MSPRTARKIKANSRTLRQPEAAKSHKKEAKEPAVEKAPLPFKQILEKLLILGKKKGFVTYEQINEALPPNVTPAEKIEEAITMLNEKGIEIASSKVDQDKGVIEEVKEVDVKKDKAGDEEEEQAIEEYGRSRMDDPVRMYLRQMGQIPLLTREQEIALAKRIEDCEDDLKRAVYETRAAAI